MIFMRPRYKHGGVYALDLRPYRNEFAYFVSFRPEQYGIEILYSSNNEGAKERVTIMHALNYFTKELDMKVGENTNISNYYTFPFINFLGGDGFFKDMHITFIKCLHFSQLPSEYKLPLYKIAFLGVFANYKQTLKIYNREIDVVDLEKNKRVARKVEDVKNLPWISDGMASNRVFLFEICNYRYRQEGLRFEEFYDLSEEDYFGFMNEYLYDNIMYVDIPPEARGHVVIDWENEKPRVFPGYD